MTLSDDVCALSLRQASRWLPVSVNSMWGKPETACETGLRQAQDLSTPVAITAGALTLFFFYCLWFGFTISRRNRNEQSRRLIKMIDK